MQLDLGLLPEGLGFREDLIGANEERALIDRIAALPLTPFQFQGFEGKRLTHSFGWRYDFQTARLSRTEPLPDWLLPLRDRAAAFAGLAPDDLIHALVIRYDPGAAIGWHRDRPAFDQVIGISLGSPTELRLRRRAGPRQFERATLFLPPRSAYHLSGPARHQWEHSILHHPALRFSVTFRSLSERGKVLTGR